MRRTATTASAASDDRGERRHQRRGRERQRHQPQDRAGHDAERALRPDEELEQGQPGDVLDPLAAEGHERAVGQHDVEAEDVVGRHAVLHAAQAAGVGGDVAADRADLVGRRVRRVPEAVLARGGLHLRVEGTRLDDGHLAVGIDLDGPHPLEAQHDAAVDGARAAGEPRPRTSRHHRDAVGRRPADRGLHLARRPRPAPPRWACRRRCPSTSRSGSWPRWRDRWRPPRRGGTRRGQQGRPPAHRTTPRAACTSHVLAATTSSLWAMSPSERHTRARVIPDPTNANHHGAVRPQKCAMTPPSSEPMSIPPITQIM